MALSKPVIKLQRRKPTLEEKGIICKAAETDDIVALKKLISSGVDVTGVVTDWFNYTGLHYAASNGSNRVVSTFISAGADVNATSWDGWTPAYCAAMYGHTDVVAILAANGADMNMKDNWGRTLAHRAAVYGHTDVVAILAANGADMNMKNDDGCTPLDIAVRRKHSGVVSYLTEFNQNKKKLLQLNLNKAKRRHGTISVRFLKLFFTGSGAAGKSSFIHLLLQKSINKQHHSTNVVHANHAVSVRTAAFYDSSAKSDKVDWVELDSKLEISYLRSVLLPDVVPKSPAVATTGKQVSSTENVPSSEANVKPVRKANRPTAQKPGWLNRLFVGAVKGSSLSTFGHIIDSTASSDIAHKPGEVLNIITLLDTGGQPEYIHLLPTINIYPTVTFVVHDLSKSLDDQVLVEYSQHGQHVFTPYHLSYTNLDMIKLLMSAANDCVEKPTCEIPQLVRNPGTSASSSSYICMVGTHADKVPEEIVLQTEKKLTSVVNQTKCEAAVWQNDNGKVLFSVDNTTAGSKDGEDPVAKTIRSKIETLADEKEVYELPITWTLLQLEIRQACSKQGKAYISFRECVALARETGLMSKKEEVRSVLLYHHLLGVLIYFEKIPGLRDYVIVDHQWWFDKLSSVICVTFQQDSLNHQAVQKLKYHGLLSSTLLKHVEWKDDIKQDFFLSLLVHMRIIALVATKKDKQEKEYFIPFILPAYNLKECDAVLDQYGHLQGEPLLIQFQSGLLPRGLFCSLIVELLQFPPKGWYPHFSHTGIRNTFSNLVTFSLPNAYSLSLFDKVSYLEVHIRHPEKAFHIPVHVEVYNHLTKALRDVCNHLNFDSRRLQYGFICRCGKASDDHIAVLPDISPSLLYAGCSIESVHRTKLGYSHLSWFFLKKELADQFEVPAAKITVDSTIPAEYTTAEEDFREFYPDLLKVLPMKDAYFIANLVKYDLLPGNCRDLVAAEKTKADMATAFLDHVIVPSLKINSTEMLNKLLRVMDESGYSHVQQCAERIKIKFMKKLPVTD